MLQFELVTLANGKSGGGVLFPMVDDVSGRKGEDKSESRSGHFVFNE